jgi:hypothetical protein
MTKIKIGAIQRRLLSGRTYGDDRTLVEHWSFFLIWVTKGSPYNYSLKCTCFMSHFYIHIIIKEKDEAKWSGTHL